MTPRTSPRELFVSSEQVQLAVQARGDAERPTVVLVHGFPDTHRVWDLVAERLEADLHVVTYDVRGAGASTVPSRRLGFRVDALVDDLVAVIDHASPDRPVHLVGHDWGSVQVWSAVLLAESDPRLRGRIASFTSISGPALQEFSAFVRTGLRRHSWRRVLRQLRRSWYVAAFQVPVLPELVLTRYADALESKLVRGQRLGDAAHWSQTFGADAVNGLGLYRANLRRAGRTRARTRIPVQLVVPLHDGFLGADLYADLDEVVDDLTRVDVPAGHWVQRTHPDLVADRIRTFVTAGP